MKKTVFFGLLAIVLVFYLVGCESDSNDGDSFVAVTNIIGVPSEIAI